MNARAWMLGAGLGALVALNLTARVNATPG